MHKKLVRLTLDSLVLSMFLGMLVLPFTFFGLSGYKASTQVLGDTSQRGSLTPSQIEAQNRLKTKQTTPTIQQNFTESDLRDKR